MTSATGRHRARWIAVAFLVLAAYALGILTYRNDWVPIRAWRQLRGSPARYGYFAELVFRESARSHRRGSRSRASDADRHRVVPGREGQPTAHGPGRLRFWCRDARAIVQEPRMVGAGVRVDDVRVPVAA